MYNYEMRETVKSLVAFTGSVAAFSAVTYGGRKIGYAFVDAAEDAVSAGAREVRKAVKKKFRKKKFFGMI